MENCKKRLNEVIELYTRALSVLEPVKEVVKKFDGKVYNVRFERAIKDIPCVCARKTDYNIEITWFDEGRRIYLTYAPISSTLKDKRINSAIILASIESYEKETREYLEKLINNRDNAESIIEKYNGMVRELEEFGRGVTEDFKMICRYHFDSLIAGNFR